MKDSFIMNEYKEALVEKSNVEFYVDSMENFGYEITQKKDEAGKVKLYFKRAFVEENREELKNLETKFDKNFCEYETTLANKNLGATTLALSIGIVAVAFLTGATFAYLAGKFVTCAIGGLLGFMGCGVTYPLYKKVNGKNVGKAYAKANKLKQEQYDVLKKAYSLVNA